VTSHTPTPINGSKTCNQTTGRRNELPDTSRDSSGHRRSTASKRFLIEGTRSSPYFWPTKMNSSRSSQRSKLMSAVRQKGTSLELVVRQNLKNLNLDYEANVRGLPGTPDIANLEKKRVIFVNGCFWHGHLNCPHGRLPASNVGFWSSKIAQNVERDRTNISRLEEKGYKVLTLWECQLGNTRWLSSKLERFFRTSRVCKTRCSSATCQLERKQTSGAEQDW